MVELILETAPSKCAASPQADVVHLHSIHLRIWSCQPAGTIFVSISSYRCASIVLALMLPYSTDERPQALGYDTGHSASSSPAGTTSARTQCSTCSTRRMCQSASLSACVSRTGASASPARPATCPSGCATTCITRASTPAWPRGPPTDAPWHRPCTMGRTSTCRWAATELPLRDCICPYVNKVNSGTTCGGQISRHANAVALPADRQPHTVCPGVGPPHDCHVHHAAALQQEGESGSNESTKAAQPVIMLCTTQQKRS
jgi:hypothetical protein